MPPRPHSEPCSIVSHSSLEQRQVPLALARPALIRSITSTPRVEPMRHGVHLPHDSCAQNSIA